MNIEVLRDYCLTFKGVTEELPFGPSTLVFKVMGKMFALMPLDVEILTISLKNTPEKNIELRADHSFIKGAFHMNKTHWNSVDIETGTKYTLITELISDSYKIVASGLTKKLKEELENL